MAENDIELNIGVNGKYLEESIKKVLGRVGGSGALKTKSFPKSPFGAYAKEKTQVGKVHLDPLNKDEFKKLGKLWKLDLFWKWIKGAWGILLKTNPMLKSLMGIFDAAISLISMALLYPFLDDIIGILKGILSAAAGFFNWSKENKGAIKKGAEIGFDAIVAGLGLSGIVKVFAWLTGIILKTVPGFNILAAVLKPAITWLGEKGLTGILKGIVAFAAKFIDPLLWATLISEISGYIFDWVKGWSDNPTWQAFWGGMSELARIVSEITDVFGWVIDIFTGKGFDRIEKIGGDIIDFGAGIKSALGATGSLAEGNLKFGAPLTADGGIVTGPQVRLVGEAGPEAIIPLDQMKNMGGTSITVNGMVDEYKFRSIIREEIEKSKRRLNNSRGAVGV